MASFLAALPPGHSIRSATSPGLLSGLSTEPLIMESMVAVPASLAARKEWAAAAEYLTDPAICKDVAAVVALSPTAAGRTP